MKKFFLLLIFTAALNNSAYSQNASTFFPSATGYKWFYKNTPLDSLNNPQTGSATYQVDSFAFIQDYKGLLSSGVLSKSGLTSVNQQTPYTDTNHYNFQTTNAYYYLNVLSILGTIPGIDSVAFVNFLRSFEAWYNSYRFAQSVNTNYTIFSRDTTLTIDTLTLPLRLSATGRRYNDQVVSTINGNYTAKKFLMTFTLSYGLLPPFIYIPIVTRPDTVYIAQDVWVVKDVSPSVNVDLTAIGFPVSFTIPGTLKELTSGTVGINSISEITPGGYTLYQNYPNPFNPSTKISYTIPEIEFINITVYDVTGNEISTLVNRKQIAGNYEVSFTAGNLPSGVYFVKLTAGGNIIDSKRMILLK